MGPFEQQVETLCEGLPAGLLTNPGVVQAANRIRKKLKDGTYRPFGDKNTPSDLQPLTDAISAALGISKYDAMTRYGQAVLDALVNESLQETIKDSRGNELSVGDAVMCNSDILKKQGVQRGDLRYTASGVIKKFRANNLLAEIEWDSMFRNQRNQSDLPYSIPVSMLVTLE